MHERNDFLLMFRKLGVWYIDGYEAPLPPRADLAEFGIRGSTCDTIRTRLKCGLESLGVSVCSFVNARILESYVEQIDWFRGR
jgi:hypothetical protein